ncbi:unnamed protein product [Symbiodinium microadriaticum]|nr:unnamed protein product [Symbiodinium microadriaticum]
MCLLPFLAPCIAGSDIDSSFGARQTTLDRWLLAHPSEGNVLRLLNAARGWVSEATMLQNHINAHLSGPLEGEVQSARTPTLRHVPAAARRSWCQAFTRALAAEAHRNDLRSWVELLMLPQAVLCPPPRRGRKHLKAAAAFTLDRLHRWQQGDRAQLWDSRPVPRARFDRKACAALLFEELLPQSQETACALDSLHPAASPPAAPSMQELPLAPELADELVARCLREFPPHTAPGPTGLRVQHLREACVAGSADLVVAQLAAVVNLLAQGLMKLRPFWLVRAQLLCPSPLEAYDQSQSVKF